MQPQACLHIKRDKDDFGNQDHTSRGHQTLQYRDFYFTRNPETRAQYSKRCPHMGSCSGSKCAQVNPDSLVDELYIANKYVGITYCTESVYHVPTDSETFEVFHCPTWSEKALLTFEQTTWLDRHKSYDTELKRNVKKQLHGTTLQLTSIETSHILFHREGPIHSRLPQPYSFSYACINDYTHNSAVPLNQNCSIQDTCKCNPAEDSMNCYCSNNNISQIITLDRILPIQLPDAQIRREGRNSIVTMRTSPVSSELAIWINSSITHVKLNIDEFTCTIPSTNIEGCYKCMKGAVTHVTCTSNITSHSRTSVSNAIVHNTLFLKRISQRNTFLFEQSLL
ncbi:hypothetical protein COOONC_01219 [Cooperia oncophora]